MVNAAQLVLSAIAGLHGHQNQYLGGYESSANFTKSIAIVGAGTAGLAMLRTLIELPDASKGAWDITLYEQRHDVGGIWLPELHPVAPPTIPETPLYPLLRTNTPVPSMAYPGFPFPKGTSLYPSHKAVQQYLDKFARHFALSSHIKLNHSITSAVWVGNASTGYWNVTYEHSRDAKRVKGHKAIDHLIVATGNNHYPHIITWPGQETWLNGSTSREILHSVWYRNPERYANKTVVIVGYGASGRDAVIQISGVANRTYLSQRSWPEFPADPVPHGVEVKPQISHFASHHIVFNDSTTVAADAVLLATGYEVRVPFLSHGHALDIDPNARSNESYTQFLTTNLRYLFPLYRHIVSLCPTHMPTALAFIGLPIYIANGPSDVAQSLLVAHAIANASVLPPREDMLHELAGYEEYLRSEGYDPYTRGHRLIKGEGNDYQDALVRFLRDRKAIPDNGHPYVEKWRRDLSSYEYMKRGWKRVEAMHREEEWLDGVETEMEWVGLMKRLNEWQRKYETGQ